MIAIIISVTLAFLVRHSYHRRPRTTRFKGPPNKSFLFGVNKDLFGSPDLSSIYGNWEKAYGPVYEIPSGLGSSILVLQDPKAITDLLSKDTIIYHQARFVKALFQSIVMVRFKFSYGFSKAILRRLSDGRPAMYW